MPDTIELARRADYIVNNSPNTPDGLHQYKGTYPLEIPISFKLHFNDRTYCKEGGLTLLKLAARLESFVLPISTFSSQTSVSVYGENSDNTGRSKDSQIKHDSDSQNTVYTVTGSGKGSIQPPVTCWLHLIWINNTQAGISCIGYVKDLKVKFGKPWNKGPGSSFNIPSTGEYSFTFVHHPGHGNTDNITSTAFQGTVTDSTQAYADDVKSNLFNTRNLVWQSNYQGFSS
jgi:hypothetical protein